MGQALLDKSMSLDGYITGPNPGDRPNRLAKAANGSLPG